MGGFHGKGGAGRIPVSWALWARPQVGQRAESPESGVLP